jgi:hypothetical protein
MSGIDQVVVPEFGAERLVHDLHLFGFEEVEVVEASNGKKRYAVIRNFEIVAGRFTDRIIDLAIDAPLNYPQGIGASIQVKADPQLINQIGRQSNGYNIQNSPLGSEWKYWSHNFGWQPGSNISYLIAKINNIFKNA